MGQFVLELELLGLDEVVQAAEVVSRVRGESDAKQPINVVILGSATADLNNVHIGKVVGYSHLESRLLSGAGAPHPRIGARRSDQLQTVFILVSDGIYAGV